MKFIHKGKVIPNFVVRFGGDDGKQLELIPVKDEWLNSRSFLQNCMNERDLGPVDSEHPEVKTAMREFMEETTMVQRVWQDGNSQWSAGRFTKAEFVELLKRSKEKGWVIQYGKAKWLVGGGRGARAAGKLYFASSDVTGRLYRERLLVDDSKLDAREKIARSPILLANPVLLSETPVVKFSDTKTFGVTYVTQDFAERVGLNRGDKLWPIKASVEIVDQRLKMIDADILVSKDDSKFVDHTNDGNKLASLMGSIPELTAEMRSSKAKDRVPKLALDTMQWLFPEVMTAITNNPQVQERLNKVKRIVEGRATLEETLSIGEYTKPDGSKGYPQGFQFLMKGQPLEDRRVRRDVFKAAATYAIKSLSPMAMGAYGVCMPLRGQRTKKRLVFLPPWMLPFWVETEIDTHVIGVDTSWVVDFLGKDFDGDMAIVLQLEKLMNSIGVSPETFPDWSKDEDKLWARGWMSLPEKKKATDPRDVYQVMLDGLQGYGLIGVATNAAMQVVDALRTAGKSKRELMGTYLKMMSMEVQQFVDSIKYTPGGLWRPRLEDFTSKKGNKWPGLCTKYGAKIDTTLKIRDYFRAVRGMDFDALAKLPEDPELSGSFYYQLASLFRGLQPVGEVNMEHAGARVLEVEPYRLPEGNSLDNLRKSTYRRWKNEVTARVEYLKGVIPNRTLMISFIATCWAHRDVNLALALEASEKIKLLDIYKEHGLIQVPKAQTPEGEESTDLGDDAE